MIRGRFGGLKVSIFQAMRGNVKLFLVLEVKWVLGANSRGLAWMPVQTAPKRFNTDKLLPYAFPITDT
jgi:hypothetical protein